MKYQDGNTAKPGDLVEITGGETGTVVFSLDSGEFLDGYLKEHWEYLGSGIMVDTSFGGLVHYQENSELISLLRREVSK